MSSAALSDIRAIVGPAGLVEDEGDWEKYLVDERHLYRGQAALIVRPGTTEEVSRVVGRCAEAGLGVVPQGGNTGYCGGATPFDGEGEVLLSLERLNRIRDVDPVSFTLTCEAGVVLATAQAAAEEEGLLLPLSMGSEGSCQIGGNLSTNAGGLAVLRYGTARDLVLGLEVVLPDGSVISELKGLRKDNTGYALPSLFIGAEGTLGVITAAVLKLFPRPRFVETAWLAVQDPRAVGQLLAVARQLSGDCVSSFEYITAPSLDLVLRHIDGARAPLGDSQTDAVLLELTTPDPAGRLRAALERIVEIGFEQGLVVDGVVAESGPQRESLWRLRESIPEAEKHAGGSIKHDVSVRIDQIPQFLQRARTALDTHGNCPLSVYGHAGDGNLHYNVLAPEGTDPSLFKGGVGATLSEEIHKLAADMGGSFSAEHGIGVLKAGELARFKSEPALATMKTVKAAIDPHGIMNPGKLFAR